MDATPKDESGNTTWNFESQTASAPGASPSSDTLAADALPGYALLGEVHRGGQGVVYQAIQKSTGRRVAIKVMRAGPFAGPEDHARFDREVQVLARLNHPNIVTIHDRGAAAGCHFYVMDYISGAALDAHARVIQDLRPDDRPDARREQIAQIVRIFAKVCRAVDAAHVRGIIHRDLKPSNVRVDVEGEPHILDFGLAKIAFPPMPGGDSPAAVTNTGHFLGSLPWASPEQAAGRSAAVDQRSDVYSLGVMLFQLLTRSFPVPIGDDFFATLDAIRHTPPRRPRDVDPAIDADIETIILKCLEKEPARRYASAGEVARDLEHHLAGRPIEAKRDSLAYVIRKRGLGVLERHPWMSGAAITLIAAMAAQLAGIPLLYYWTGADEWFKRQVQRRSGSAGVVERFEHVRLIALSDDSTVPLLAQSAKLEGVTPQRLESLRRLHGFMMERLADSGVRTLVFDIAFRKPSPFDADFARGAEKLQRAGCDVVVVAPTWTIDDDGLPEISPAIRSVVRWGCSRAELNESKPWSVELAMQRPPNPARASLSLAGVASFLHPGAAYSIEIDQPKKSLILSFTRPSPADPRVSIPAGSPAMFQLVDARLRDRDSKEGDLLAGDLIATFATPPPAEPIFAAATHAYATVLAAPTEQLREWFEGRCVMIVDTRPGRDRFLLAPGVERPGCHAHASGIEAMLTREAVSTPGRGAVWILNLSGGAFGVLFGRRWSRAPGRRVAAVAVVLLGGLAAGLGAYAAVRFLCNPGVPVLAALLASEASAGLRRAQSGASAA